MINCPECGQAAADDAKFCDRCGQGLSPDSVARAIASITPLAAGNELKGGYRIAALISQTARENRYRAERDGERGVETFMVREQPGPAGASSGTDGAPPIDTTATAALDPAGPRAKTADLKLRVPGSASNGDGAAESAAPVEESHAPQAESADGEAMLAANPPIESAPAVMLEATDAVPADELAEPAVASGDLGEVFGRVLALSQTLKHPAFQRAQSGFADKGRVYLVYPQSSALPPSQRIGTRLDEGEALNLAIQMCQAVGVLHRRGLRVNDICPESVVRGPDGRIVLTGLDYVSNDDELNSDPIFNDGYTAPEIYRGRRVDKRADIFAIGALIYTWLTGARIEAESWREEAGTVRFYPPHVVTPALEQVVRRAIQFDPSARWPTVDALKAELVKLAGAIRIRAAAFTDVGMVRELNEDAVMAVEYWRDSQVEAGQGFLYVIADGMGGAEAGEIASAIAVGAIREQVELRLGQINFGRASQTPPLTLSGRGSQTRPPPDGDAATLLQEATEEANRKILEYASTHPEARGMGSTAVGALIHPPDAVIAWVGDSRAYHCGDNGLHQISKDHSLVQRLVEIGQITAEEARHHEHKNVITRSLGARPNGPAGVETRSLRLKRGDRLLLCSDGLTAHVEDPQIADILRRNADPYAAARELVVAANAGGGTDNVSVVVIFAG
jgi:serine/threonine protein phosphatase PrpC/serine/threonine protein kinase